MATLAAAQPGEPARQRPRQPEAIGDLANQRGPRVADRLIVSVRRHRHSDRAAIALHLQGDPPEPGLRASATRKLPAQPDRTSAPAPAGALASCKIRANAADVVVVVVAHHHCVPASTPSSPSTVVKNPSAGLLTTSASCAGRELERGHEGAHVEGEAARRPPEASSGARRAPLRPSPRRNASWSPSRVKARGRRSPLRQGRPAGAAVDRQPARAAGIQRGERGNDHARGARPGALPAAWVRLSLLMYDAVKGLRRARGGARSRASRTAGADPRRAAPRSSARAGHGALLDVEHPVGSTEHHGG